MEQSTDAVKFIDAYHVILVTANPKNKAGFPIHSEPRDYAVYISQAVHQGFSYGVNVAVMDLHTGLATFSKGYVSILAAIYSSFSDTPVEKMPKARLANWVIDNLTAEQFETRGQAGYYRSATEFYRDTAAKEALVWERETYLHDLRDNKPKKEPIGNVTTKRLSDGTTTLPGTGLLGLNT